MLDAYVKEGTGLELEDPETEVTPVEEGRAVENPQEELPGVPQVRTLAVLSEPSAQDKVTIS